MLSYLEQLFLFSPPPPSSVLDAALDCAERLVRLIEARLPSPA